MKPIELPKNSNEELFGKPFTSCLGAQAPHSTYSSSLALRNVAAWRNLTSQLNWSRLAVTVKLYRILYMPVFTYISCTYI